MINPSTKALVQLILSLDPTQTPDIPDCEDNPTHITAQDEAVLEFIIRAVREQKPEGKNIIACSKEYVVWCQENYGLTDKQGFKEAVAKAWR